MIPLLSPHTYIMIIAHDLLLQSASRDYISRSLLVTTYHPPVRYGRLGLGRPIWLLFWVLDDSVLQVVLNSSIIFPDNHLWPGRHIDTPRSRASHRISFGTRRCNISMFVFGMLADGWCCRAIPSERASSTTVPYSFLFLVSLTQLLQ